MLVLGQKMGQIRSNVMKKVNFFIIFKNFTLVSQSERDKIDNNIICVFLNQNAFEGIIYLGLFGQKKKKRQKQNVFIPATLLQRLIFYWN